CCSGVCSTGGVCEPAVICKGPSVSCTTNSECCTNSCVQGACAAQLCKSTGMTCAANNDCCSTICNATTHVCDAVPAGTSGSTCKTLGEACTSTAAGACCSTNCQGGVCVRAFACQANGDICSKNSDCCGNACGSVDGGVGRCVFVAGGGAGGCLQDGNPCP